MSAGTTTTRSVWPYRILAFSTSLAALYAMQVTTKAMVVAVAVSEAIGLAGHVATLLAVAVAWAAVALLAWTTGRVDRRPAEWFALQRRRVLIAFGVSVVTGIATIMVALSIRTDADGFLLIAPLFGFVVFLGYVVQWFRKRTPGYGVVASIR